jgi:hypothetical protein
VFFSVLFFEIEVFCNLLQLSGIGWSVVKQGAVDVGCDFTGVHWFCILGLFLDHLFLFDDLLYGLLFGHTLRFLETVGFLEVHVVVNLFGGRRCRLCSFGICPFFGSGWFL